MHQSTMHQSKMYQSTTGQYLEATVAAADPLELVRILYRGAIEATGSAKLHAQAGRIAERSQSVNRALAILAELSSSLDIESGGEVARQLAALYDYIQRRVIDAHTQQSAEPLVEVQQLLSTLLEAWDQCCAASSPEPVRAAFVIPQSEPEYHPLCVSA